MKGIVLAGGTGTRLWPITLGISKQLMPIYDKPMIYYPISTLMQAGIREILIITTPQDQSRFIQLLGNGNQWGITLLYETQEQPKGIADAFIIGENFISQNKTCLILGDNIFHGSSEELNLSDKLPGNGSHIFTYEVANPSEYGVIQIDQEKKPIAIIEKPVKFVSNLAVTGLYFFDENVVEIAKGIAPSVRGELEITSVIETYLKNGALTYTKLSRCTPSLDTGNVNSMNNAATYIRVIEERTGLKIGCLEEIAWRKGWINDKQLLNLSSELGKSDYGDYLRKLLK
jgi:glucose-1-phosphate thymidylyltransferase